MPDELSRLIERLERAEAGSLELDAAVGWLVGGLNTKLCPTEEHLRMAVTENGLVIPTYTTSLDAALALVGEQDTGLRLRMQHSSGYASAGLYKVRGFTGDIEEGFHERADGELLPLCVVIALCRALQSQQEAETYVTCPTCGGSGLQLNMAGEPDECSLCGGNTVVTQEQANA